MADCECLTRCQFFNDDMKDIEGLGSIYRQKYCLGDNSGCARYTVFRQLGRGSVPANLYPNMHDRAQAILSRR